MTPGFVLFSGRLLGTAHIITLAPPRPDNRGRHIIEARIVGNLSYTEEFDDPDEAAGRYLSLAASLIGDPAIADGVESPRFDEAELAVILSERSPS